MTQLYLLKPIDTNPVTTDHFRLSCKYKLLLPMGPIIILPVTTKNHAPNMLHSLVPEFNACATQGGHITGDSSSEVVINSQIFNDYDQSTLNRIDPDVNYLSASNVSTTTRYFSDKSFRNIYGNNTCFSMFHLNIRSVPEHFRELTSFVNGLDIEFKVIALCETWIKSHHADFNIPNTIGNNNTDPISVGRC